MRKLIVLLLTVISAQSYAASTELLQVVLNSEFAQSISDIHKIEIVGLHRCRNCYDILITGVSSTGPAYVKVTTSQEPYTGPIKVNLLEKGSL